MGVMDSWQASKPNMEPEDPADLQLFISTSMAPRRVRGHVGISPQNGLLRRMLGSAGRIKVVERAAGGWLEG